MGRTSNPSAGPLLAWLGDHAVKDRISRLHRKVATGNREGGDKLA